MTSASTQIALSTVRDWAAVEAEWRALEGDAMASFFQSWTWVGCLAEERFPNPVLLRAQRNGHTVGLALLNRMRARFGTERLLLNESGDPKLDAVYIEHNGVLLARDAGDLLPACLRAILTAPIASDTSDRSWAWSRQLRLAGVDATHLSAARQVARVRLLRHSVAPFVDLSKLSGGSDPLLTNLSANTRYQIRRSNRSFTRLGPLEVRRATSVGEAIAFLDALAVLHQATWRARGLPGAFANPAFLRFHHALVARALPRGETELLRISAGPHVIGYLYNFRVRDDIVTYQSGFDYPAAEAFAGPHAKPGLTCHHAAILLALTEGAATYDFLAGPDRYKKSLTRSARPLYWLEGVSSSAPRLGRRLQENRRSTQRHAGNVLVLGDDTRGFLAIVRSLGRHGIKVHVAPANFRSPALGSRYIAAIHELPPWMGNGAEWLAAMQALLCSTPFDLVIPCNETTLLPVQHCRAQLSPLARLAIPNDREISVLFDKQETRELARRSAVPIAPGRLLRDDDTPETVMAELGLPIVLKPRWSYTLQTLASRGKVQVVRDQASLKRLLSITVSGETIIEQFFAGQGVGVSLLASRGRVLQAFEHHRVHETAGASFYRVSAPLTPGMASACEAIVAALSYTGLAMFEFKRNDKGDWILLEVNARPWGSMPLPVALGVDFPYRWYRLLTSNEETPSVAYRSGVYGRNFLPDLQATVAEATAQRLTPALARFLAQRGMEFLRPLAGREVNDLFVRDDPRPALIEFGAITKAARERASRVLPGAVAWRRRQARAQIRKAARRNGRRPMVLFVCQGNICRSPFAEALLRNGVANAAIAVGSAGLMPMPGRSTPAFGLQSAAIYELDLSDHRSIWLTRKAAEAASLLVIFDEINRASLFDYYPKIRTPVIRLGDLTGLGNIPDPIDGDLHEFQRVYRQIADGITELSFILRHDAL